MNARRFGLAGRASFVQCDYAATLSGSFDLIVSNPPYIRSSDIATLDRDVRDHDPHLRWTAARMVWMPIVQSSLRQPPLLGPDGVLIVETGHDQSTPVSDLMRAAKLTLPRPPVADLGGIHRAVMGRKAAF